MAPPHRLPLRHLPSGSAARFLLLPLFPECFVSWLPSAPPFGLGNSRSQPGKIETATNAAWGPPGNRWEHPQDNLYYDGALSGLSGLLVGHSKEDAEAPPLPKSF